MFSLRIVTWMARNSLVAITLLFAATSGVNVVNAQEDAIPDSPVFHLVIGTIHTDGKEVMGVEQVAAEGKPVEQKYIVTVPFVEDGVTKTRAEARVRLVAPTKAKLVPISKDSYFQNLSGEKLEKDAVVAKIPMSGLQVLVISDPALKEIPLQWKNVLREDIIILRVDQANAAPAKALAVPKR
jgi:hypothetical protein